MRATLLAYLLACGCPGPPSGPPAAEPPAAAAAALEPHEPEPNEAWTPVFRGIDLAARTEKDLRPAGDASLRLFALRVDLSAPGIDAFTTPGNGEEPLETTAQTAVQFLEQHDLAVAVNAMFFRPCCEPSHEPKDVRGLAVSEGDLVSPRVTDGSLGSEILVITAAGRARVVERGGPLDLDSVDTAIAGSEVLLRGGEIVAGPNAATGYRGPNPRTVAGVSQDGRLVYLVVIDGRQPLSRGCTLREAAEYLSALGAYDAINLDGGGSTALVVRSPGGAAQVANIPVGGALGQLRFNGNHIGFRADRL